MDAIPTIRRAGATDAARLARFAEATFRETFATENTPENMELHCASAYGEAIQAKELADAATTVLLCELAGELVGYAQLRRGDAPACVDGARPIEILRFYVASGWHGRGIAQLMMASAVELADGEGSDVVWLGVWERNPRAIAFYAKLGFVEAGDHVFPVGNDPQRDVVMMLRRVPPAARHAPG
jgi:ribosomal protein S18 acetylase RimI-like enzyme